VSASTLSTLQQFISPQASENYFGGAGALF
jgi:hypothetical protein